MKKLFYLIFLLIAGLSLASDHPPRQKWTQELSGATAGMSPSSRGSMPGVWGLRNCIRNNPDGDPCNTKRCRHYLCIETHGQASCMSTQSILSNCVQANLSWGSSSSEVKADGISEGNVNVEINALEESILLVAQAAAEKPIIIYELEAKQGIFIDTGFNKTSFTLNDYLEKGITFRYRTYDCDNETIVDKEYDTFTLSETSTFGKEGIETTIQLKEIKVPFICQTPYYTVTTSEKTTTIVKPIENYRGIGQDLKSYQEDINIYYIYIDADKAKIVQYHVDAKSTRNIHREKYTLNMDSCQYEIEKEDKLIKNMGGRDMLKSEDAGWGFEDDTNIYVVLPSSEKELSFTWGSLRETGHYRKKEKYKKEIPLFVKNMMVKMNDAATLFRKESKNNQEMEIFKSLYDYPGTPKHVQCGGKVAMESFLIPPLDGLQDPDIDFRIDIRPSTKAEIKVMKKYMKNGPKNPMEILKLLQSMQ